MLNFPMRLIHLRTSLLVRDFSDIEDCVLSELAHGILTRISHEIMPVYSSSKTSSERRGMSGEERRLTPLVSK